MQCVAYISLKSGDKSTFKLTHQSFTL